MLFNYLLINGLFIPKWFYIEKEKNYFLFIGTLTSYTKIYEFIEKSENKFDFVRIYSQVYWKEKFL